MTKDPNIFQATTDGPGGLLTSRTNAGLAALKRQGELELETGQPHRRRWDAAALTYTVEPTLTPGPDVFMCADFTDEAARTGRDARDLARDAAQERLKALEAVAGLEHRQRWSTSLQAYWIEPIPFKAPERPWNMTDNQPPARRPDWERKPTIFTAFDRLIPEAAPLQSLQWLACNDTPHDGRTIDEIRTALQQGLDAQWGRGHFWAYNHGHRISIQCRYPLNAAPSEPR